MRRLEPLEERSGVGAVDVRLLEEGDGGGGLKAVAWADVLEGVEELRVVLVRLVAELVAGEPEDGELVSVLVGEGVHCGEVLGRRAS